MNQETFVQSLMELFPGSHPITPDPVVAGALFSGETVVWQGRCESDQKNADHYLYAVTDRRLLSFYKGMEQCADTPDEVEKFRIRDHRISSFSGASRVPSVIWRTATRTSASSDSPDIVYYGFFGVQDPEKTRERLKRWRTLLYEEQERRDVAFAGGDSTCRTNINNTRSRLTLAVPRHWQGRMVTQMARQAKLLWFKLPFKVLDDANEVRMPDTTDDWNRFEIQGLGGVNFTLETHDGPLDTTFDEQMDEVRKRNEKKLLLRQEYEIRHGSFTGFSMTVDYTEKKGFKWQDGAVRRIWLGSPDHHFDIYASVRDPLNSTATDVLDAIVASIGEMKK